MEANKPKSSLGIPSWAWSLMTAFFALLFSIFLGSLLGSLPIFDENIGEGIAYVFHALIIASACFFICRQNPKSIWYVPILCNTLGIISALFEPNFWITPLWMVICGGWVLSIIGAILGAAKGKRTRKEGI